MALYGATERGVATLRAPKAEEEGLGVHAGLAVGGLGGRTETREL